MQGPRLFSDCLLSHTPTNVHIYEKTPVVGAFAMP